MQHIPKTNYPLQDIVIQKIKWFQDRTLNWYYENGRKFLWRKDKISEYGFVISEILLQRTKASKCNEIYPVFIDKYPDWLSLASAQKNELQTILKPLGLWRQKSESILSLAKNVVALGGALPKNRDDLEKLPSVGQYIASAILLSYGFPEPLLDVNMARVLERFFGSRKLADIRDDPYLQTLSRKVIFHNNSKELNWAILDLGALICKVQIPNCQLCPVKQKCQYFNKI